MPTYNTLVNSIYQISSNTVSMQTTLSGGKLSFLALTVSLTVYVNLYATAFTKTSNPGPAPSIPPNATRIEQTAIWYKFTLDKELYYLLQNMDKALNKQLLGDVEDI